MTNRYVTFDDAGIHVDIGRYLRSEKGKAFLNKLSAADAAAGASAEEWTDDQCCAFLNFALRNVDLNGEVGPSYADVRLGVRAALHGKPSPAQTGEERAGDCARAEQWIRSLTFGSSDQPHVDMILEALCAYDPRKAGAITGHSPEDDTLRGQLGEMKRRAQRAHSLCNQLRLAHPGILDLGDDGALHQAIQDILRVDTPEAFVPSAEDEAVWTRFDLSPAGKESAVRDKLIELGWTPPEDDATVRVPSREELASLLAAITYGQYNTNIDLRNLKRGIEKALKNFDIGMGTFCAAGAGE